MQNKVALYLEHLDIVMYFERIVKIKQVFSLVGRDLAVDHGLPTCVDNYEWQGNRRVGNTGGTSHRCRHLIKVCGERNGESIELLIPFVKSISL